MMHVSKVFATRCVAKMCLFEVVETRFRDTVLAPKLGDLIWEMSVGGIDKESKRDEGPYQELPEKYTAAHHK